MKTIFKYPAPIQDYLTVDMPEGAEILCVKETRLGINPVIYALVDPEAPMKPRQFFWYPTGCLVISNAADYIGTVFMGDLVFHLFNESIS